MTLVTNAPVKEKLLEQFYEREARDVIQKFYETIKSNVVFAKNDPDSLVGLITYPNSGTSWFLQLTLAATRIENHTVYREETPEEAGQKNRGAYVLDTDIGHLPDADQPALVKSHVNRDNDNYDAGSINSENFAKETFDWITALPPNSKHFIRLIRNPFDNLRSRYHLYLKLNAGKPVLLNFRQFFRADLRRYLIWHALCNQAAKAYPLMTVHYADFLRDDNEHVIFQQAMQFAGFDITPDDATRAYKRFPPRYEGRSSIPLHLAYYSESDIVWVAEEIRNWLEILPEIEGIL